MAACRRRDSSFWMPLGAGFGLAVGTALRAPAEWLSLGLALGALVDALRGRPACCTLRGARRDDGAGR